MKRCAVVYEIVYVFKWLWKSLHDSEHFLESFFAVHNIYIAIDYNNWIEYKYSIVILFQNNKITYKQER